MTLEVHVDRTRCIGSRTCVNAAPRVFRLDGTGIALVVDPDGDPAEEVLRAAEECPTHAIAVVEDAKGSG